MDIIAPQSIFPIKTRVRKKSGSWWEGKVVGYYSTEQTPDGVAVQLDYPNGPVQIYPASALELAKWAPPAPVTQEYAESNQWWNDFRTARIRAIDSMLLLNQTEWDINLILNLRDIDHVNCIINMYNLRR